MPPAKKKTAAPKSTNLFAVVGSDDGKVKEAALKLSQKLAPPEAGDFGIEIIDGIAENAEHAGRICADTIQAIQTLPFFGGEKLVWLKSCNFAADNVTGRAKSALEGLENLAEILAAGFPNDVRFLISAPEIDKRRSFYKNLIKLADTTVLDKADSRDGWEGNAASYVSKLARERNLNFRRDALEFFVAKAGENSTILQNELEKLDTYLGPDNRDVTTAHVSAIVSLGRGGIVFEIGDAIGKRDLPRAIRLVDHFLFRGESAIGILLAAFVPKLRSLLYAKDLEIRLRVKAGNYPSYKSAIDRADPTDVAHLPRTKKGEISAYPLFLASGEARRFPLEHLQKSLENCLTANRQLVTTSLDHKLVLHQLLAKILVPA